MVRRALVFAWVFTVLVSPGWGADPVFDIPRLDGITIDGDVSDWGDRGFYVGLLADETRQFRTASDFDGRLRLGWDEEGLLVRAEGRDDQYVEHPEDWAIWAMDAVELFMAVEPGSKDRYQICVAPGQTEAQPDLRIQFYEFRDTEALRQIRMTGDAAATRKGDTYFLEVRMPWSNLALTPEEGMTVGFQIYLNDQDPDDPSYQPRYTAMWYPGGQSNWNPERMYAVRLAQEPSPPVLSMATVNTFSEVPLAWIEVNAVKALVGQHVAVTGPALREPASAEFVPHDGRAVARVYLPTRTSNADPAGVALLVEDAPVLNVARIKAGIPSATLDNVSEGGTASFRPRLEPRGQFPAAKKATVTLYNARGKKEDTFAVLPGDTFSTDPEPGAYFFAITYPDVFGEPLQGGLGFGAGFPGEPEARLARLRETVSAVTAQVDEQTVATYEGYWLYKLERLEKDMEHAERFAAHEKDLLEWLLRPLVHPRSLQERRGVFEWAYRSEADGSGQPFTLTIPYGLDTTSPVPSYLWLHGSGGGHNEPQDIPGALGMSVLARGRSQGYWNLAEADVFDVYDYVRARWKLDPERLTVLGASMGGGGAARLAARRPDLFAGAAPLCGASSGPFNNLINVPLYAVHGSVDDLVPIGYSRAMIDAVARMGGMAVLDVAHNYAHGLSGAPEQRAQDWVTQQVRTRDPKRVSFTATDGGAMGAYGLQIIEWGPEWRPATFEAVRDGATLYLTLDNIRAIEVGLRGVERVSVNQGRYLAVPAYDGAFYVTVDDEAGVGTEAPAQPGVPFHTPGGAISLYDGQPLLVVWGTQADEATNAAMLDTADRMRRTPAPSVRPESRLGEENFMPYGRLYGKPDTDVTDEDLRTHHLVLIGTAEQNSAVARIASGLPLALRHGVLQSNDGVSWPADGLGWALTYYNPMAPGKRVLWLASDDSAYYAPGMPTLPPWRGEGVAPDLIIADAAQRKYAAMRNFDSRWRWATPAEEYLRSPLLPERYCSREGYQRLASDALLSFTKADATLIHVDSEETDSRYPDNREGWVAGTARLADVQSYMYAWPTVTLELSAEETDALRQGLPEFAEGDPVVPEVVLADDAGDGPYTFVMNFWQAGTFLTHIFEWNDRLEMADIDLAEVIRRGLPRLVQQP